MLQPSQPHGSAPLAARARCLCTPTLPSSLHFLLIAAKPGCSTQRQCGAREPRGCTSESFCRLHVSQAFERVLKSAQWKFGRLPVPVRSCGFSCKRVRRRTLWPPRHICRWCLCSYLAAMCSSAQHQYPREGARLIRSVSSKAAAAVHLLKRAAAVATNSEIKNSATSG